MNEQPTPELVAEIEAVFRSDEAERIGYWPDDLMAIVREPYTVGAIYAHAHRDGGIHIPADTEDGAL